MRLIVLVVALSASISAHAVEAVVVDQAEFSRIVPAEAKLEKLAGDMKFLEGPVWLDADGGMLIFSDIPASELKKWTAAGGLATFRANSNGTNGNILDGAGRLVSCEQALRRITRTAADGTVSTLAERCDGKRFSSPNDVAVKSDGTIWFTDPPYGVPKGEAKETDGNYVYRLDPATMAVKAVITDCNMPNGLCFSPDEKRLYVADSGKPHHIRVFNVAADGALTGGEVFCVIDKGGPDGIRCDATGRLWSSAGDGVHIFAADGKLIGRILVPETPANLCFGGKAFTTLFITARKSLYSVEVSVAGAKIPAAAH